MDFMHCTTCGYLVQVNPTGTCLGCQQGFRGPMSDRWTPQDMEPEKKGILDITCEEKDATQERIEQSDSVAEHKDRNCLGERAEASRSDSPKRRRKSQKKA